MSIENSLERIAVALESIAAVKSLASDPVPVQPVAAPKPRAAAKAAPAPAVEPVAEDNFLDDEPQDPPKEYTKDEVRAAVVAYQKRHTADKAKALLASFGAETLGKLAKDKYAAVIEAAKA